MNREQLRKIQHLPAAKFYDIITNVVNDECERARSYMFYNACICMFSALRDRFPEIMTGDMLHSIAVDMVEYSNGFETPAELDAKMYQETGFSAYEVPSESKLNYIAKGEQND